MPTLKQQAYQHILHKLLHGDLRPGDRLSNRKLAQEIGISLIPVREATTQLVSEGLAEHRPGLGSFVASLSREELADLYDFREALECHAATRAAERISADDLALMRQWNQRLFGIVDELQHTEQTRWTADRIRRWQDADIELHLTVFRGAGNRRALETVQGLNILTRLFAQRWTDMPAGDSAKGCADHADLIDALETRDAKRARAVAQKHIRQGCKDALAAYDQSRMSEVGSTRQSAF